MRKTFKNFAQTSLLNSVLFAGGGQTSLRAEALQEAKIAVIGSDVDVPSSEPVSPIATIAVAFLGYSTQIRHRDGVFLGYSTQEVPVNGRTTIMYLFLNF